MTTYKVSAEVWHAIQIDLATSDPPIERGEYSVQGSGLYRFVTTSNQDLAAMIRQQPHEVALEPSSRPQLTQPEAQQASRFFEMKMDVIVLSVLRNDLKDAGYLEGRDFRFVNSDMQPTGFPKNSSREQNSVVGIVVKNSELLKLLEMPGNSTRFFPQAALNEPQKQPESKPKKLTA